MTHYKKNGKIVVPITDTVRESVIITLVNLARMFTPAIQLTLVARHKSDDAAFMIFSEDSLEKVIEVLQRHLKEQREAEAFKIVQTKVEEIQP
jgi:hypothetical protein